jgi:hypothetical protein
VGVPPTSTPDRTAPARPSSIKRSIAGLRATLRWRNPADGDFQRVRVIVNRTRRPRSPADGLMAYTGKATTAKIMLRPGRTLRVAIFAYDRTGNVSKPAYVELRAPVEPLTPGLGETVAGSPVLRWKAVSGASYYHVQVFRAGERVVIAWPVGRSLRMPRNVLRHGASYVWYVWPGIGAKRQATYGRLIGTGRFQYR